MMVHTKTILARTLSVMYIIGLCFFCFANIGNTYEISQQILGIPMDKIIHFIMFLPFPILVFLSFEHKKKTKWESFKFVMGTLLAGIVIAASTEVIQGKLPYRALEISDFYSDCLAIFICSLYVLIVDIKKHSGKNKKS